MEKIGEVKKISEEERCQLEKKITIEEVSKTLKIQKIMLHLELVGSRVLSIRSFGVI